MGMRLKLRRRFLWMAGRTTKETWHEFFGRQYQVIDTHWLMGELVYVLRST